MLNNQEFIDYVIGNDKSITASVHRMTYFKEIIRFGMDYYCLDRDKTLKGLKMALANTYLQVRLQRINLSEVNLHDLTFRYARDEFFALKKEEQKEVKRLKLENEELIRFLIGEVANFNSFKLCCGNAF